MSPIFLFKWAITFELDVKSYTFRLMKITIILLTFMMAS
jgi:hypothetical protein